ncbi:MAG: helix-turn-helix domain-containing protein [Eubacteriales bacterium]|nr:helix-turn-helix domain-containing protein [Eubacteriales bacterium]
MSDNIVTLKKEYFFKQNNNVHIHISNECKEFVGVLHRHEFIEIVYIISGRAKHIIGNNEYSVKKGDVSVINANEVHAFIADTTCNEEFLAYDLMFTPEFLDNSCLSSDDFSLLANSFLFYSIFPDEIGFKERFNLIPNCNREIGSIFEKIYDEYKNSKTGYVNLIRLYIAEIIIKLLRKLGNSEKNTLTDTQKHIVEAVIEYIENNYSMKIKVDEIASRMFFSKNYLSKIFKKETGSSIHGFLTEIRIKEVLRLLTATNDTISDIALSCGFTDMKSFYSIFKKYTGQTPKQYRDEV